MPSSMQLTTHEIQEKLIGLPEWEFRENALERVYQGKSYMDALEKLNAIAQASEAADHHPDLILSWRKLTVRYWTHTAQGVTELDFQLARQVEEVLAS